MIRTAQSGRTDNAATDLASAPGVPAVIDGQTWFTVRTLGYMGQSVRESSIRRPCLTGFVELSSNDTSRSAGWSLASCDRVVPQFTRTTRKTEMNPDGSPAGTRSVNPLVP
ncbi:hypothetical protein [Gordonia humi]|uniref:Uncharacterized protein n=1 Tax=Gordonia humi TaxID=686429 RepID=A0A840EWD4_9ACTN|nr:hypothetical protein [Gordonia humi]MBB4135891.1 hypothetical protein [Gordonia humi]